MVPLGSIGFEPLSPDGENHWQTKHLVAFNVRKVEVAGSPAPPGPPGPAGIQHFDPRNPGGRSSFGRQNRIGPPPGQVAKTTQSAILGAELASYEIVNNSGGIVTVKKLSRFATDPVSAGRPPYLVGQGEGSFDIDTNAGCVRSYNFAVKVIIEGNSANASTVSLTYRRHEGGKLANLPAPSPLRSSSGSPGDRPRPAPQPLGGSPSGKVEPPPSFLPAPVVPKPVEIPSVAARSQAEKLVEGLFKKELAALDSSTKRIELARTLLAQAGNQRLGTADHYVLLEKARDLAMVGGDIGLTCQLIDMFTATYKVDELKLRAGALAVLAETVTRTDGQRQIAAMALDLLDRAIAADDFEEGRKFGRIAYTVARKTDDKALVAQTAERGKAFKEIQKNFEDFQHALAMLKDRPKDAAASTLAGKYYCFVKDDWKQGLPLLAQGDDAVLAGSAAKELASPADSAASFELAESWDDLAEREQGIRHSRLKSHARSWYQKALPALDGLARIKAEKALAESPPDVVVSTVSSYRPTGGSRGPAPDLQQLLDQIGPALRSGNRTNTREIGAALNKAPFSVVPEPGGLLIGFDIISDDRQIVALRPIFLTAKGQTSGQWYGGIKAKSKAKRLLAKAGYAVGAIRAQANLALDGLSVVFMEIGSGGLNPSTAYESSWVGLERRPPLDRPTRWRWGRRHRHSRPLRQRRSDLARTRARAQKVSLAGKLSLSESRRSSGRRPRAGNLLATFPPADRAGRHLYGADQKSATTTFSRRSRTIFTYA